MNYSLHDDPQVPEGSIVNSEVHVVQYVKPDGSMGYRVQYEGAVPLSQVLGLLAMAAIDLKERCDS